LAPVRRITLLTNPDVCNLRCPLCFLNQCGARFSDISGFEGEMDFDVARGAVERFGSFLDEHGSRVLREVIPSTMGEPLLYSRFKDLLSVCSSLGIPVNLTTNGTFPGFWGESSGMSLLLQSCSDIKVSSLASENFGGWKKNVESLLSVRRGLLESGASRVASVSVQVTLHRKNLMMIPELIAWATAVGIGRIKWNSVVFLSCAKKELRDEYELDRSGVELRNYILNCGRMCGNHVLHEGSLIADSLIDNGSGFSQAAGTCPFADELWILPDGSEQHCPNPERRFGDAFAPEAKCCFIR